MQSVSKGLSDMINGDVKEFVEHIRYGDELVFIYNNTKYFLQGWTENGISVMVLDIWEGQTLDGYAWETTDEKMAICAERFLSSPIFDGKTFWEVEKVIEWVDD